MKKEEEDLSFKHWLSRTVMIGIILFVIVYALERALGIPMVTHAFLAVVIVLMISLAHEALHYWRAIRLGYKPKWYRTKIMMGFEIGHHSSRKKWLVDKKKIALAPYYFLIPLSLVLVAIGINYNVMGIYIGGIGSIIIHGISLPFEGRDV